MKGQKECIEEKENSKDIDKVMPSKEKVEAEYDVVVVGAGIAGLACATALYKAGVKHLLLLDKYDGIRSDGAAVLLYPNGWHALEALGLADELETIYPASYLKKQTNLETGKTKEMALTGTMDRPGLGVRAVHRKELLEVLAKELPQENVRFSSKLASIKCEQASGDSSLSFKRLELDDKSEIRTKVLIGCDGVHSVVSHWLGLSQTAASQRSIIRGLAEFESGHKLSNELQEYILKDRRGACVPVKEKEVYWYITHDMNPKDLEKTMHPKRATSEVTLHLAEGFPNSFVNIVQHSVANTVKRTYLIYRSFWGFIFGWHHRNLVTVAGDAFHPIASDLSLGSCMALEDAVILARHISSAGHNQHDLKKAIDAYVKVRRWRVAALAAWSYLSVLTQHSWSGWGWGFLGWVLKFVGRKLFDWFWEPRIMKSMNYDCRVLNNGNNY